jgi:glycerophosphoryl diester phosphodiesterase
MTPTLVAHRGYWERYPENTLVAIEAALQAGACVVEFDVQICADDTPVLMHDASLERTAGIDGLVFELDSAELAAISVHEPARLGESFRPAPVPALAQVLALFESYPAATAMVEIKQESIDYFGLERTIDELLDTLQPYAQRCVIIAYNPDALVYARACGHSRIGWVLDAFDDAHRLRADELKPDYLICNHNKITPQDTLWPGGWRWMLYDITDADTALALATRGADLIETRDIGRLLQHPRLSERGCGYG